MSLRDFYDDNLATCGLWKESSTGHVTGTSKNLTFVWSSPKMLFWQPRREQSINFDDKFLRRGVNTCNNLVEPAAVIHRHSQSNRERF